MLPALLLLALAAQPAIERCVEPHRTLYTATEGDCRISLETYPGELNRRGLHYRASCPLPFAEQAPRLASLLRHVIEAEGSDPARFNTLFWGRLHPDAATDHTLASRLSRAAQDSPLWNPATGRPRRGDPNSFAIRLANDAAIFRELQLALRAIGYDARVTSMEKLLVLPARRLPFLNTPSSARLPFDAMTWLSLSPLAP